MSTNDRHIDLDQLLGHAEWVRRLARSILADAGMADDVVQETYLKVLERPPRDLDRLAHWFRKVGRNLALSRRRQLVRSAVREKSAARSEVNDAAAGGSIVERAESHRMVVDVVLSLDEPYRTCVLMRWFDGLEPDEIAKKLGAPASTVRVRLMRALEMIRGRLDAKDRDDHSDWKRSLILLAGFGKLPIPRTVARTAGAIKKLQAAAAVLLLVGVVVVGGSDTAVEDVLPAGDVVEVEKVASSEPRRAALTSPIVASVVSPPPFLPSRESWTTMVTCSPYTPMAGLDRIRFIVRDTDRRPVGGAAVVVDGQPFSISGIDGSVALAGLDAKGLPNTSRITISRSDYATLDQPLADLAGRFLAQRSGDLDVILPDPGDIVIAAIDSERPATSGVEFRAVVGRRTIASAKTDAKGEATFTALPVTVDQVIIECADPRFVATSVAATPVRRSVVRYSVALAGARDITARILDSSGSPRSGTTVRAFSGASGLPLFVGGSAREATTNERGEIKISGHLDGPIRMLLRPDSTFLETQVTLDPSHGDAPIDCVLPSTHLRLRFAFEDGVVRPVRVAATPMASAQRIVGEAGDGTANLAGLPIGESICLRFTLADAADIERRIDGLVADRPYDLTIDMPKVASVGVALTGTPEAVTRFGLVWTKLSDDGTRLDRRTVMFDPDGYARCELAPGEYEYVLFEVGGAAKPPQKKKIECSTKFSIEYRADHTLRGILTDQDGSPLVGWTVGVFGSSDDTGTLVTTDAEGHFEFRDSRFEKVNVFGRGPGFREPLLLAASVSTSDELALRVPMSRVVLRVREFDSGQPARRPVRMTRVRDPIGDSGLPGRFCDAFLDPTFGLCPDEGGMLEISLPNGKWIASVGDEANGIPRGSAEFETPTKQAAIDLFVVDYSRKELSVPVLPEEPIRLKWSRTVADRTISGEVVITGASNIFH